MTLGEKLCTLRKKNGMSQEALAARVNVSRQAISKWELGEAKPDTENILRLSELFGVSTDYLLKEDITKESTTPPPASAPKRSPLFTRRQILVRALIVIAVFAAILIVGIALHATTTATSLIVILCVIIAIYLITKTVLHYLNR